MLRQDIHGPDTQKGESAGTASTLATPALLLAGGRLDRNLDRLWVDQGYGLVCDLSGRVYPDLIVAQASQEHGILAMRSGSTQALPHLSIGAKVRIQPNQACATASQHDLYNVVCAGSDVIEAQWPRMRGC
ncbi:hypothetical protein ACRQ5Q_12010 [Bradyrhizobium sp. PMVTL-01]|uniref:hypothetical protein n=1 Tax=unclassified Bradyrhizobium TaxID=2631580 RepID=UPI003F7304B7